MRFLQRMKSLFPCQLSYSRLMLCVRHVHETGQEDKKALARSRQKAKRARHKDGRHVIDSNVAAQLTRSIMAARSHPTAPFIHVDAGPGLVCREFLTQEVSSVLALESTKLFASEHKTIQQEFGPGRFQFVNWHMLSLRLKLSSPQTGSDADKDKKGSTSYAQTEAHVAQLIQERTTPGQGYAIFNIGTKSKHEHFEFLFYILRNMPNYDPILCQPGVEFFFMAHPRLKYKLQFLSNIATETKATRYSAIMAAMYLLYDISFIGEFPSEGFEPPFSSSRAVQDPDWVDSSKRLLVKMCLKQDMESVLPLDHHVSFLIFLRQLYTKKVNRTIPTMEMLVPGCGLRMLALDFTMLDVIIRTKPERFLVLYKHMVEWPEYQLSPLRNFILQKTRGGLYHWPEDDKEEKADSSL